MVDLKPILVKLIEQLPSVINELSPEEFKVVQDTLNLAREKVFEELVSEEDLIPKGVELLYLLAGGDPNNFNRLELFSSIYRILFVLESQEEPKKRCHLWNK